MIPLTPYRTSFKVKGSGLWVLGLEENGLGLRLGFGHRVLGTETQGKPNSCLNASLMQWELCEALHGTYRGCLM